MDTVQLQCGSCKKVMAISTEHLGGQVECPHCRCVVQTPTRAQVGLPERTPPPPPPPPEIRATGPEIDSIFSDPEENDDVFGGRSPQPQVEMPAEYAHSSSTAISEQPSPGRTAIVDQADDALPTPTVSAPRQLTKPSMGPLIAMIFLVPYAILTTLYISYLLMQMYARPNPLDMLPDPVQGKDKGNPRRVEEKIKHDIPLAINQKTTLGESLRVGDIEVTPLQVVHDENGDLKLELKVKNISANSAFNPISDQYLLFSDKQEKMGWYPYTFLQTNSERFYGGYATWHRKDKEVDSSQGELKPHEEEVIAVSTMSRYVPNVKQFVKSNTSALWRVQLRRGFVAHRDREVSATTVIGVQFHTKEIVKGERGASAP